MKKLFFISTTTSALVAVAIGCQEKPELQFAEYGETIPCLPRVENLPKEISYPPQVEPGVCTFRDRAYEQQELELKANEAKLQEIEQKRAAKS